MKRLRFYIERLDGGDFLKNWEILDKALQPLDQEFGQNSRRDRFLIELEAVNAVKRPYLETIRTLAPETSEIGTQWLASIVDDIVGRGSILNPHASDGT